MNFNIQETLKKIILFFDENLRLETIFYRIFICKLQWLLCYYLLSFVWKRDHDRAVWHEKVSAHNGAKFFIKSQSCIDNLKAQQNMLYRAAKVDFWQAIPPLWQPHQRAATATAGFYFTKSMQSSRSYLLWRPSIILLRRLKVAILKFSLIILSIMYMLQLP